MRKIESCPAVVLAFLNGADGPTAPFVAGNRPRERFSFVPNEDVVFYRVHVAIVDRSVNPSLRRFKRLADGICVYLATSVFDLYGPRRYHAMHIARVIMPRSRIARCRRKMTECYRRGAADEWGVGICAYSENDRNYRGISDRPTDRKNAGSNNEC